MYVIKRTHMLWKPYEWTLTVSAYGYAAGRCWTRRGCERAMLMMQGRWFGER